MKTLQKIIPKTKNNIFFMKYIYPNDETINKSDNKIKNIIKNTSKYKKVKKDINSNDLTAYF